MNAEQLRREIEALAREKQPERERALAAIEALWSGLEAGSLRAAEPAAAGWVVNAWVKLGILLAFRVGRNRSTPREGLLAFRDRDTLPLWHPSSVDRDVRIVPGGSSVRRGAFLGDGVVMMPPSYVNVGARVEEESMVDSHALVGSCAQIGRRVHLSAAAQIGGVLEPIGALPVIVEDDVFVGGGCGVYEGTRIGRSAVLAPGVVLTRAVPVFDLVHETTLRASQDGPLAIPDGAVVVPGSRPAAGPFALREGLTLQAPVIVKYRDPSTDAAVTLEQALR